MSATTESFVYDYAILAGVNYTEIDVLTLENDIQCFYSNCPDKVFPLGREKTFDACNAHMDDNRLLFFKVKLGENFGSIEEIYTVENPKDLPLQTICELIIARNKRDMKTASEHLLQKYRNFQSNMEKIKNEDF